MVGVFGGYGPPNVTIFIFHSLHGLQFPLHFLAIHNTQHSPHITTLCMFCVVLVLSQYFYKSRTRLKDFSKLCSCSPRQTGKRFPVVYNNNVQYGKFLNLTVLLCNFSFIFRIGRKKVAQQCSNPIKKKSWPTLREACKHSESNVWERACPQVLTSTASWWWWPAAWSSLSWFSTITTGLQRPTSCQPG